MESRVIGKYTIYSDGRIHDEFYGVDVKPTSNKCGRPMVKLFINGIYYNVAVQNLVAKLFMKDYKQCMVLVHLDGDLTNNDISNLAQIKIADYKNKKIADSLPTQFKVTRYDKYSMQTDTFTSLDEAALYMQSTGIKDELWKIKLKIWNVLDEKSRTAYNYKWNSV